MKGKFLINKRKMTVKLIFLTFQRIKGTITDIS